LVVVLADFLSTVVAEVSAVGEQAEDGKSSSLLPSSLTKIFALQKFSAVYAEKQLHFFTIFLTKSLSLQKISGGTSGLFSKLTETEWGRLKKSRFCAMVSLWLMKLRRPDEGRKDLKI
jgi:hypothetical protein